MTRPMLNMDEYAESAETRSKKSIAAKERWARLKGSLSEKQEPQSRLADIESRLERIEQELGL